MKKIKVNRYRKIKFGILVCLILCLFIIIVHYVQCIIEPQLHSLATQHTGYAIHYVVKEAIGQMDYDVKDFINVEYNKNGEVADITYDTKKMNDYLVKVLNIIDNTLQCEKTDNKHYRSFNSRFQDGVIYEAKLGYFFHSYMLSNLGPTFKIRLRMYHDAIGNIIAETNPYGVDSTLLKISLVVHVDVKASTYISSYNVSKEVKVPLVIQIVKGDMNPMYPYSLKK